MAAKLLKYRHSQLLYLADWASYCDAPVSVYRHQRGSKGNPSLEIAIKVPCRKCARCMRFRRLTWRDRCAVEIAQAPRSWFVTLTFDAMHLAGVLMEAHKLPARRTLPQRVEAAAYRHVQLYFKRLRKAGYKFRYLAVMERGSINEREHFHFVLHEIDKPIPKRVLENEWRSFVHARLVREAGGVMRAAGYLTKYLTKSDGARPRASARYGVPRGTVASSVARTIEAVHSASV